MALARSDLQRLAETRLREARTLFEAGHYAGAYYLAGYVVELSLKACIAKQFKAEVIPDWKFSGIRKRTNWPIWSALAGLRLLSPKRVQWTRSLMHTGRLSRTGRSIAVMRIRLKLLHRS